MRLLMTSAEDPCPDIYCALYPRLYRYLWSYSSPPPLVLYLCRDLFVSTNSAPAP